MSRGDGMALKLGELLVKHQMITEAQLAHVLRTQHIFGGRLGTNLVELGYLTESLLVRFLGAQLNIPTVKAAELDEIKEEVVKSLPRAVAEKFKVIPISQDGRKLRLAMADPTHLKAIDEVAFATGCTIAPLVAPELLITYALEKYYGIVRPVRYVRLSSSTAEFELLQTSHPKSPSTSAPEPGRFGLPLLAEDFSAGPYGLKHATKDLAAVNGSKEVFQILKKLASQDFQRGVIFVVQGEVISGWHQLGSQVQEAELRKVSFPLGQSSFLRTVSESEAAFVGTIPSSRIGDWLVSLLGQSGPEVLAMPIKVIDQAVGILVAAEPNHGALVDHVSTYSTLAEKMSLAIQMSYMRKRILDG
jgi:hypothetical protein